MKNLLMVFALVLCLGVASAQADNGNNALAIASIPTPGPTTVAFEVSNYQSFGETPWADESVFTAGAGFNVAKYGVGFAAAYDRSVYTAEDPALSIAGGVTVPLGDTGLVKLAVATSDTSVENGVLNEDRNYTFGATVRWEF